MGKITVHELIILEKLYSGIVECSSREQAAQPADAIPLEQKTENFDFSEMHDY